MPWKGIDKLINALILLPKACLTVVVDDLCCSEWEALAPQRGVAKRCGPQERCRVMLFMH
jgi:hypothetical protein